MSEPDTTDARAESLVRDFYARQSLPEDRVDAILAARALSVEVRRWKRLAIMSSVALAAMSLIAFGLWASAFSSRDVVAVIDGESPELETPSAVAADRGVDQKNENADLRNEPTIEPTLTGGERPYLLVAFESHGDGCPFCRETRKSYREAEQHLKSELVQFEQFHLGDPEAARENAARIEEYQLDGLIAGRTETAFLALTARNGEVLRMFKPSLGGNEIAMQVRDVLSEFDAQVVQ